MALGAMLIGMSSQDNKQLREDRKQSGKVDPIKLIPYDKKKSNQKKWKFHDGFECEAINKKNAERKHKSWLKKSKGQ